MFCDSQGVALAGRLGIDLQVVDDVFVLRTLGVQDLHPSACMINIMMINRALG